MTIILATKQVVYVAAPSVKRSKYAFRFPSESRRQVFLQAMS